MSKIFQNNTFCIITCIILYVKKAYFKFMHICIYLYFIYYTNYIDVIKSLVKLIISEMEDHFKVNYT